MEFLAGRHFHSDNLDLQGLREYEFLSPKGRREKQKLASEIVRKYKTGAILTSPSPRAMESALAIYKEVPSASYHYLKQLSEIDLGDLNNKSWEKIDKKLGLPKGSSKKNNGQSCL